MGEIQASIWPKEMEKAYDAGINLLLIKLGEKLNFSYF